MEPGSPALSHPRPRRLRILVFVRADTLWVCVRVCVCVCVCVCAADITKEEVDRMIKEVLNPCLTKP